MTSDFEPISVDLARESDFSVGPLRIRPSLRQVESEAGSETLEPRIMQVLVVLARRRGEVVSKDELIQACWGGRVVGEDAITRCISKVRKLGEAGKAFGLETIPKVGYRLLENGAAALAAQTAIPGAVESAAVGTVGQSLFQKPIAWAVAAGVLVLVILGAFLLGGGLGRRDVDAVVAEMTSRLAQSQANPQAIDKAGQAAKALGGSARPEEQSAFAALASGNSAQAVTVLEDFAAGLEKKGDTAGAADVYTRIGALALVFDQGRGMAARRKAFMLRPDSLANFQGLFLDTALLRGPDEAGKLAAETLARPGLSDRMRGWVLVHRGLMETDMIADDEKAAATLDEIKALDARSPDPVAKYAMNWLGALMALNQDDLAKANALVAASDELWKKLPEHMANNIEVTRIRALYASGDWSAAFSAGVADLELRGRAGDFLPTPTIETVCDTGIFTGQVEAAAPYCRSLAQQREYSGGALPRAFAGLLAAGMGDTRGAASEFSAAEALLTKGPNSSPSLLEFEAYAAVKRGDFDAAEKLAKAAIASVTDGRWKTQRSFIASVNRMLAAGMISGGQPARACAPLKEAARLYAEVGGEAGRVAVDTLRGAAGCRP